MTAREYLFGLEIVGIKLGLEQIGPEGTVDFVARDALLELGYTIVEADRALATTDPEAPPEERVRQALRAA